MQFFCDNFILRIFYLWSAKYSLNESDAYRLRVLRSILAETDGYRFFSSSILIAFDAEAADSSGDDAVRVHLIDFANSTFNGFLSVRFFFPAARNFCKKKNRNFDNFIFKTEFSKKEKKKTKFYVSDMKNSLID